MLRREIETETWLDASINGIPLKIKLDNDGRKRLSFQVYWSDIVHLNKVWSSLKSLSKKFRKQNKYGKR